MTAPCLLWVNAHRNRHKPKPHVYVMRVWDLFGPAPFGWIALWPKSVMRLSLLSHPANLVAAAGTPEGHFNPRIWFSGWSSVCTEEEQWEQRWCGLVLLPLYKQYQNRYQYIRNIVSLCPFWMQRLGFTKWSTESGSSSSVELKRNLNISL